MGRLHVYRTEAIILRAADFGEADRLLTLLTLKHGKLRAIAKGVRRATSRQGGHLQLFSHVEAVLAVGRELDIVTQSEVRQPFRAVREDLERTSHAYFLVELVDGLVEERSQSPEVFGLTLAGLLALERGGDPGIVLCQFQLHLLDLAGFGPQLFRCASCHAELEPVVNAFSAESGGVLCPRCQHVDPSARPLSLGAFKLLRHLRRNDFSIGLQLRSDGAYCREGSRAMRDYVERVLERRLRSPEFIARLSRV